MNQDVLTRIEVAKSLATHYRPEGTALQRNHLVAAAEVTLDLLC